MRPARSRIANPRDLLMLTPPQRAELETLGPYIVRLRLQVAAGRDALSRNAQMTGFRSGLMTRGEVEDWLSQRDQEDAEREQATRKWWARIAGWAGVVGARSAFQSGLCGNCKLDPPPGRVSFGLMTAVILLRLGSTDLGGYQSV